MKKALLFVFALQFIYFSACFGQSVITTTFADSDSGWPAGPAETVMNTICQRTVTLAAAPQGETLEIVAASATGSGYRIGGGNPGSMANNIVVTITFDQAVWDPILCVQSIDSQNESLTAVAPLPTMVNGDLMLNAATSTITSSQALTGQGCLQWQGPVNQIQFTFTRPAANWGMFINSLSFLCCEIDCGDADTVNEWDFGAAVPDFQTEYSLGIHFLPGEYVTASASDAAELCQNWNISGPDCDDNAAVMLINGRTSQNNGEPQSAPIVFQSSVSDLDPNREYLFCAQFKNLNQCCFNVTPVVSIEAGGNMTTAGVATSGDPCDWQEVSVAVIPDNNGEATITIRLQEDGIGDGNDLAIGGIRLLEGPLTVIPAEAANFIATPTFLAGGLMTVTATAANNLPDEECISFWSICEDVTMNAGILCTDANDFITSPQWNGATTNFNGYIAGQDGLGDMANPGIFFQNSVFSIHYTVDCPCADPVSRFEVFGRGQFFSEEDFKRFIQPLQTPSGGSAASTIIPNPTKGTFLLRMELPDTYKTDSQLVISVSDVSGRIVSEQRTDYLQGRIFEEELTLAGQPAGMYMVTVTKNGELISSERVVKTE